MKWRRQTHRAKGHWWLGNLGFAVYLDGHPTANRSHVFARIDPRGLHHVRAVIPMEAAERINW